MTTDKFQPHYVAYATFHGKTPEEMLAFDKQRFPGGCMTEFLCWIPRMLRAFRNMKPEAFRERDRYSHDFILLDQAGFTEFLQNESRLPERCREFVEAYLTNH